MTRPYSNDLRERVVGAVSRGELSCRQAARHYDVGISTAIRWVRRLRRTGSVSPDKIGGYRPKKLIGPWRLWLLERCRGGDFTLRGRLPRGVGLRARGETQSQKKTLIASEQDRPDIARRRAQWLRYRHRIDP
jgi:transposase